MYKSEKELKEESMNLIVNALKEAEMRQGCTDYKPYASTLLRQLEPLIFNYSPLPISIQEALNSGDGVYRP